jgi:hypothetical protein
MTLKTEAKLLEICDLLAQGNSYSNAGRISGVSPRTVFQWLKMSAAGDEDFVINYMGEDLQFTAAAALARKALHMDLRANFEKRNLLGWDEVVTFQGRVQYVVDTRVVGWSEEDREAFGFRRDGYLEDAKGCVIPLTIHREPPIAGVLATLAMSFPEEYVSAQNINVTNTDTAGVRIAAPIDGTKIAVPLKPARPAEIEAPVEDGEYEDLLGPVPVDDDEPEGPGKDVDEPEPAPLVPTPVSAPRADPVVREAVPANLQPTPQIELLAPNRPMSPLLRDLISRVDAPPEIRSAPIPRIPKP